MKDARPRQDGVKWRQISPCYSEWNTTENSYIVYFRNFQFNDFRLQVTRGH